MFQHPYIGPRASDPRPDHAVAGVVVLVEQDYAVLLLADGSHASRGVSVLVMDDPAKASARIAASVAAGDADPNAPYRAPPVPPRIGNNDTY